MYRINRVFVIMALLLTSTSCSKDEAGNVDGNVDNKDFRMSMTVSDLSGVSPTLMVSCSWPFPGAAFPDMMYSDTGSSIYRWIL